MVKKAVEYLMQHPEVIDQLKEGRVSLIGLSGTEQKAVLDVFSREKNNFSPNSYWD